MVVGIALSLPSIEASAQAAGEVSEEDLAIDAQVMEQISTGTAAYRKRDYERAVVALNAAWLLKQSGAIGAMLAEVEAKLGRYDAAATHWAYAMEQLPPGSRDAYKEAKKGLEECQKQVGTIRISVEPSHADVIIDRQLVAFRDTAMHAWVMPGSHTILAVVDGKQFSSPETFEIQAGETEHVHITVPLETPSSAPAPPQPAPSATQELPLIASASVKPESNSTRTVAVASGAGLTLVALGLGTWFGLHRSSVEARIIELQGETDRAAKSGSAKFACAPTAIEPPESCVALQGAIDDYNRDTKLANISLAVSAGLGLATIATYFLWPRQASRVALRPLTLAPWYSPRSEGIELQLRF